MLKIKDNVDLEELEKYDFRKVKDYIANEYYDYLKGSLRINVYNRHLVKNDANFCGYDLDTVYDLIQDGIVEKVSD